MSPYTINTSFLQISKNTIFAFIAVLDQRPSPVDSRFEENCEFVYHKIVDTMTVAGEGECAAKCALCSILCRNWALPTLQVWYLVAQNPAFLATSTSKDPKNQWLSMMTIYHYQSSSKSWKVTLQLLVKVCLIHLMLVLAMLPQCHTNLCDFWNEFRSWSDNFIW